MIDAGPATCAASRAPSSQPDPMIEPRDTNVRPQNPTSRLSLAGLPELLGAAVAVCAMGVPPRGRRGPCALGAGKAPDVSRRKATKGRNAARWAALHKAGWAPHAARWAPHKSGVGGAPSDEGGDRVDEQAGQAADDGAVDPDE